MHYPKWQAQADTLFAAATIIPVLVIHHVEQAISLAQALFDGGIKVLEVTLRTPVALEALAQLTTHFPNDLIGAGTVTCVEQLKLAQRAGAKFAISPGQTPALLDAGLTSNIPLIPGVASVSELMSGLALGYSHFKLFPAAAIGGLALLRSIAGPFPDARFCPTGGINEANYRDYLALPNVSCVGGSWIVPEEAINRANWALITSLCQSVHASVYR